MTQSIYTGKGIGVAVLDTGIFPHVDFRGRIQAFSDFLSYKKQPYDDNGHGTHVAGILAGDGTASMGRYRGRAPECSIIALKVLDCFGNGSKEDVLQAFEWLHRNGRKYNIRVVNISVGTTYRTRNEQDDLIQGVEKLWDEGYVVVTAAGNQGPKPGSITAPGSSRKVITVGSSDMLEGRRAVSGRGPTFQCVCKPDLVAPGSNITACMPGYPFGYGTKSGTSMSTPLVSGAIACLLQKEPTLTNVEIKQRLMESADDMGLSRNQQGWGRFNYQRFLFGPVKKR
jgi:serine protease AprX